MIFPISFKGYFEVIGELVLTITIDDYWCYSPSRSKVTLKLLGNDY